MGDAKNDDLRVGFDSRLKLRICGSKVTSDVGLLAYREVDEALRLTEIGEDVLTDSRLGANKQHLLTPLLRQSIYSRLAGYEDMNVAKIEWHAKYMTFQLAEVAVPQRLFTAILDQIARLAIPPPDVTAPLG